MSPSRPTKRPLSKWKARSNVAKVRKLDMLLVRLGRRHYRDQPDDSSDEYRYSDDNLSREPSKPVQDEVPAGSSGPDPGGQSPSDSDDSASGDSSFSNVVTKTCYMMVVVMEFLNEAGDSPDNETYCEVGLSKWVEVEHSSNEGKTWWPPNGVMVGKCICKSMDVDKSTWQQFKIKILDGVFVSDTVLSARTALNKHLEGSTYHTDQELGRGLRDKKPRRRDSSDSEEELVFRKNRRPRLESTASSEEEMHSTNQDIPPPPSVPLVETDVNPVVPQTVNIKSSKKKPHMVQDNAGILSKAKEAARSRDKPSSIKARLQKAQQALQEQERKQHRPATTVQERFQTLRDAAQKKKLNFRKVVRDAPSEVENGPFCDENDTGPSENSPPKDGTKSPDAPKDFEGNLQSTRPSWRVIPLKSPSCAEGGKERTPDATSARTPPSIRDSSGTPSSQNHRRALFSDGSNLSGSRKAPIKLLDECVVLGKRTATSIEILSSKKDIMCMNQSRLNRALLPEAKRIKRPARLPAFPLSSVEGVAQMESFLADDVNFAGAVDYLETKISVKDPEKKATACLLRLTMANQLASHYNFDGSGGKRRFSDTKLWDVIQGCLLRRDPYSDLVEANAEVRNWVRNAPWRKQDDGSYGKRGTTYEKKDDFDKNGQSSSRKKSGVKD